MTIEVLNVSKNYGGKPYLKSVSLNISSGSAISVVGNRVGGEIDISPSSHTTVRTVRYTAVQPT